jgi:predicted ATPase
MLGDAREIGQATTLMQVRYHAAWLQIFNRNCVEANALLKELAHLAGAKNPPYWKGAGMALQGCQLALSGQAAKAVDVITSGITTFRSTGATLWIVWYLLNLAAAYAELGQFDNAWHCVEEARTAVANRETWCEAEVNRVAGELSLISPERDAAKAEAYFERALAVARQQQAKSWELRAAIRAWLGSGAIRASGCNRKIFSLRSMVGSPKASIRST